MRFAVAHPLEDRPADEDRFERPPVGEPAVDEVDGAELGDRVVGVADGDPAREALGEIAEHEDQRERVGLVTGDANESGGGEIDPLRVIAQIGGDGLVEEELGEEIGRSGVGQPGELVAPFPAGDELGESVL